MYAAILLLVIAGLTGCGIATTAQPSAQVPGTAPPTETSSPADALTPTEGIPERPAIMVDGISLHIPEDWYFAQIDHERMTGLVFVQQDPEELGEFIDPDLALPLDYAAGAVVITPLPEGSDPEALRQAMIDSVPDLAGDDFDAMVLALDQVGMLDYTAVDAATLSDAWVDVLASLPAVVMDGVVIFEDALPPELRIQVWLTWTGERFVAYYAVATAQAWPGVEAALATARDSMEIR
jgi:hypothetical protein